MPTEHDRSRDDLDAYVNDYSPAERDELAAAEFAIDLAMLVQRARESRNLSQAGVAERIGLSQQAVSRIEQPHRNVTLETLRTYLSALDYSLEIVVREPETGRVLDTVVLPPTRTRRTRKRRTAVARS
jgi:transcriptional regulator with XRE-family HTH domain